MIHEIAEIDVLAGHEAAFEQAVAEATPLFRAAEGCAGLRLHRSVELPTRYRLVVGWRSVDDHMVGFRDSSDFQRWRSLVGPHFASAPRVEHVTMVLDAAEGGISL